MIGGGVVQIDALVFEQFLPKLTEKNAVPVAYYGGWHSMEFVDMLHEDLSYSGGRVGVGESHEMGIFAKPIDYYQDDFLPFRFG
jgi:hypothetical protein